MIKILVKLPRIVLFMLTIVLKLCRTFILQMWLNSSFKNFYASLSSRQGLQKVQEWSRSHLGYKRLILGCLILLLIFYFWPFGQESQHSDLLYPHRWLSATQYPMGAAEICVESKLEKFQKRAKDFDVMISHSPLRSDEKPYLPFIGNGYIGVVLDPQSRLQLKQNRALSISVDFYPVIEVALEPQHQAAATAIDIYHGVVHKVQCFHLGDACAVVETLSYAHRRRPSVLVQELRINNPTDNSIIMDLRQIGVSGWSGASTRSRKMNSGRAEQIEYTVTEGSVVVVDQGALTNISVVIASRKLPETISIKGSSTWTFSMMTVVRYGVPDTGHKVQSLDELNRQVNVDMVDVMNIEPKMLQREHSNIWIALWSSGFGISYSRASGTVNGDKINSTMYYILSNVPSPIFELNHPKDEIAQLEKLLYFPDRCYEGHHTLQNVKMWNDISNVKDLVSSVNTWLITLEKQGCGRMLRAGANGVLQAMILSYGAFRFRNDHLEFGTHPSDLHRDYFFRRINYGNDTHMNISVKVGEDNRAVLYVSLDRNNKPYYACDAGCLDAPSQLSWEVSTFPVKLTDPVTPILYITSDKQHIEELKHAIHVKEIVEAPAHEHHVMVLHKHGHHWGGLPMLFWGTIGVLILVFHLFLFKLVYNEYCSGVEPKYPKYSRGRYV